MVHNRLFSPFSVFETSARKGLAGILAASLLLEPSFALAGRKIASIRAASPAQSKELSAEQKIALENAVLDMSGRLAQKIQNRDDFVELLKSFLGEKFTSEEQAFVEKAIAKQAPMPKVLREKGKLVFSSGGAEMVVRWSNFKDRVININGMDFALKSHQSFKFQVGLLLKRLESRNSARYLPAQMMLGEPAHAFWGQAAVLLGSFVVGVLSANSKDWICYVGDTYGKVSEDTVYCKTYMENKLEARQKKAATVDVEKKRGESEMSLVKYEWLPEGFEPKHCPTKKNGNRFLQDFQQVQSSDGVRYTAGPKYALYLEMNESGAKAHTGVLGKPGMKLLEPGIEQDEVLDKNRLTKLLFDEDGHLKAFEVENKKFVGDPLQSPRLTIDVSTAEKLDPDIKERLAQASALLSAAEDMIRKCNNEEKTRMIRESLKQSRAEGAGARPPVEQTAPPAGATSVK
jgi:hypothetical protein